VDPASANDANAVAAFKGIAAAIAGRALNGQPIVVHLCDDEFRTLWRERVDQPVAGGGRAPAWPAR